MPDFPLPKIIAAPVLVRRMDQPEPGSLRPGRNHRIRVRETEFRFPAATFFTILFRRRGANKLNIQPLLCKISVLLRQVQRRE